MQALRAEAVDAYWQFQRASAGTREERLAAQEDLFWAWEFVDDAVHDAPMPEVLLLLDDLLAQDSADPMVMGAGPLEDVLHKDDVESWDAPLANRCASSARWREAMRSAVWPDDATLIHLLPYLRSPAAPPPAATQASEARRTDTRAGVETEAARPTVGAATQPRGSRR